RRALEHDQRDGQLVYRFTNESLRAAVYQTLSSDERARRHQRIGGALSTRGDERDHAEALAWHFERAGAGAAAGRYALLAGDKARQVYANETAIGYYTRALALLRAGASPSDPRMLYNILAGREEC